jgi:predicted TIM-barrel fold metal-dependent hydrolase
MLTTSGLVDTNLHVIAPPGERDRYPLSPLTGTATEFTEDQSTTAQDCLDLMDAAGVDQAFLIASRFHGFDNSYCAAAITEYPDRFVGIANIDILDPDAAGAVRYWITERGMHGVRLWGGGRGPATWIDEPRVSSVWEQVRLLGVPANAHTTVPAVLPDTARFLERFSDIPFTINHVGHVDPTGGPDSPGARALFRLAEFPLVYINIPVDVLVSGQEDTGSHELLLALLEHFGPRRLLWSAFYPSRRDRPYPESVAILREALSFLHSEDSAWVLGGAARALYPTLAGGHPEEEKT